MSQSSTASPSGVGPLRDIIGSVTDAQTYRNLLYLFLSFPLGLVYFVLAVTGIALGIGLAVIGIGLAILLATVIGLRAIATFERRLANSLLGTTIAEPSDVDRRGNGVVDTAKAYLGAGSTWRGIGFILLKFWLGVLSFVLLVSLLGTALELILLPAAPGGAFNIHVVNWTVADTFRTSTQRLLAVPLGVALLLIALPMLNGFARVNASVATSLLGPDGSETGSKR
ncbi:MAG: hypothetical protein ACI8TL_001251 [Natronomonas sp.]|jgi:hypothetical protein